MKQRKKLYSLLKRKHSTRTQHTYNMLLRLYLIKFEARTKIILRRKTKKKKTIMYILFDRYIEKWKSFFLRLYGDCSDMDFSHMCEMI